MGTIRQAARRLPFAGAAAKALRRGRSFVPRRTRPAILMYHRIALDAFDPWGLAVSPANFADQLSWLSQNRTVLPLAEFARMHRSGLLPARAVAITFDDGYACFADTAVPQLEGYRAPATVFLPVAAIERGGQFWWDELKAIVLEAEVPELRVGDRAVALGHQQAGDLEWEPGDPPKTPRQAAFRSIWSMLRQMRPAHIATAMAELRSQGQGAAAGSQSPTPMSAAQVRSIAGGNVEFGSHALNHPWLPGLPLAEKRSEICGSVGRCEALAGSRPVAFAYPYGSFDEESERVAAEAGFDCACTTQARSVTRRSRLLALPRIAAPDAPANRLERALASA